MILSGYRIDVMGTFLGVLGLFAAVIACNKIVESVRARAMRSLALRRGFQYLGGPLPTSFRMTCDPAASLRFARHVIEGQTNGVPILIFDCTIGSGRYGEACTFIATQTNTNLFGSDSSRETIVQSCGWSALYRLRGLTSIGPWAMSIQRIEDHLDSFADGNRPTRLEFPPA
jgi:hypothetical protein